jgi:hypothetical protein
MTTTVNSKMAAARSFIRTLNILLKFVRLYGFEHTRSAAQFDTAWNELRHAVPEGDEKGMLLGATGSQLLLDGAPVDAAPAERSFAQLLSAAGVASIQFLPTITQEELSRFVCAFPTGNAKTSSLAEQLKTALADAKGIRINEVRFFAEDAATTEVRMAATLTAKTLGANANQVKAWFSDPQKLLQMIVAAEGSKGPAGAGGTGSGSSSGTGGATANASGKASSGGADANSSTVPEGDEPNYSGEAMGLVSGDLGTGIILENPVINDPGSATPPAWSARKISRIPGDTKDDSLLNIFRLLSHLGQTAGGSADSAATQGPFHQELAKLSGNSREMLEQALASMAAQTPAVKSNDPMLVRLAEHLAIRFALNRYESGEVRVNAVREMIDRMSQEISALRKVLGMHEETLAQAGIVVESHADLLDRQFWAAVPEAGKRSVLTSPEAWCIPPRNLRQYIGELRQKGDIVTADAILENYGACVINKDINARRRVAIGLSEIADLYATGDANPLGPTIRRLGVQLAAERESELQSLISAAFVRLSQEASSRARYPAVLQSLDSLDGIENQRPAFAQDIRPRLGLEKRLPQFVEEAIRNPNNSQGLMPLLERMPRPAIEYLMTRFNRGAHRGEFDRIVDVARSLGAEATACLREHLQTGQPSESAETVGLLSRLDAPATEKFLGNRLHELPRLSQDRALRLIAGCGASDRGWLLLSILDRLDPLLQPLAIDEIGMSGEPSAADRLLRIASGDLPAHKNISPDFLRLKAIEALGRLTVSSAAEMLCEIAESKKLWRWVHHSELRLAAFQALSRISPPWAREFFPRSGFTQEDLDLAPINGSNSASPNSPNSRRFRQRRYPRVQLTTPLPATATSERGAILLEVRGLSLSGGLANGERHMMPGTLVTLRLGSGIRPVRVQAFMRDARAQGLSFEFADMDLDERARLRRLLRSGGTAQAPSTEEAAVATDGLVAGEES